jgi:methionine aminopeptidase
MIELKTHGELGAMRAAGSRGAHFEHTIAVTEDGPIILTAPIGTAA